MDYDNVSCVKRQNVIEYYKNNNLISIQYVDKIWFSDSFENIIHNYMKLPLNKEMIKQASSYEGDVNFLHRLDFMCKKSYYDHDKRVETKFDLNEKQINFMARMLLQNYDIPVIALQKFCILGLMSEIPTKDIEKKLKEIVDKHNG